VSKLVSVIVPLFVGVKVKIDSGGEATIFFFFGFLLLIFFLKSLFVVKIVVVDL